MKHLDDFLEDKKKRTKTEYICFRATEDENKKLKRLKAEYGITPSDLLWFGLKQIKFPEKNECEPV